METREIVVMKPWIIVWFCFCGKLALYQRDPYPGSGNMWVGLGV